MELIIDGQVCDLASTRLLIPSFEVEALAEPEASREGRSLRVTLPHSPRNAEVMGSGEDPHTAQRFNHARHTAQVCHQGATLFEGVARLLSTSQQGYTVEIRSGGASWAQNASLRMFNRLGIDFLAPLTPEMICQSWEGESPVKFFPIHRDDYPQQNSSTDLLPAERLLSVDDYHPFLHVASLVEQIFAEAGYVLKSEFFASAFFRSLYMSGAYSVQDCSAVEAKMGFEAGRLGSATTQADDFGRVVATPNIAAHSVGNVVESATPYSVDAEGVVVQGLYNNGGCFSLDEGFIRFTPTSEVSVGFEYRLRYTTDHTILSRTRLKGIDTLYLGAGTEHHFTLANRYEDRRGQVESNHRYRAIVFEHQVGDHYRLSALNRGEWEVLGQFDQRSVEILTSLGAEYSLVKLEVLRNGRWLLYAGDWALYDGYVEEQGQTTVDVVLRTPVERLSPTSPKTFHQIYFAGADPGMGFTLHKECRLRPVFRSAPGYGEAIGFADVAQHPVRQVVLLNALAHLFNLRFYTLDATRQVWVEPADDFFGVGEEVDWTARTDFSEEITLQMLAPEVHQTRSWGYQEGDGVVKRFEHQTQSEFGRWQFRGQSYASKSGEWVENNPLFAPSCNSTGHYLNAPSALLLQVGDRDRLGAEGEPLTPRLVCYAGMHPLPEGERWGYPADGEAYPLVAFHFAGDAHQEGFTLCFEERDGVEGLHRFYDRQLAREDTYERITLTLHLSPEEYEALFYPEMGGAQIRSIFRLNTGAEPIRATLHTIGAYDPLSARVRCTFNRLADDE